MKSKPLPPNEPEAIPGVSTGSREYVSPDQAAERRAYVRGFILANVPRDLARVAMRQKHGIAMTEDAFAKLWREVIVSLREADDDLGEDRKVVWLAQVKEEAARAAAAGQFSAAAKLRELQMKGEGHEQPRRIHVDVSGQVQSSVLTLLGVMSEERLKEIVNTRAAALGIASPIETRGELTD